MNRYFWQLLSMILVFGLLSSSTTAVFPHVSSSHSRDVVAVAKLDAGLQQYVQSGSLESVRIIVQKHGAETAVEETIVQLGGNITHALPIINGFAATLPASQLTTLAESPAVKFISLDEQIVTSSAIQTITVPVIADAWLKEQAPNNNFGSENELLVQKKAGDATRTIYRFDLSQIPPNATIISGMARAIAF